MHRAIKTWTSVALAFFAAVAVMSVLTGSAGAEHGTPGTTQLISRPTGVGAVSGIVNSSTTDSARTVSADGRFVVFESRADGLSSADDDTKTNVYVRDLQTGVTTFVSRATGPNGAPAHQSSDSAVISADGSRVAFVTSAGLDPLDTNGASDVYVRNLTNDTTVLVSRTGGRRVRHIRQVRCGRHERSGRRLRARHRERHDGPRQPRRRAGAVGNAYSQNSSLNTNGTKIAFRSNASNFSAADVNKTWDVYVRDLSGATTKLVSRADSASGAVGDNASYEPSINGDGTGIAFYGRSTNFAGSPGPDFSQVYLRNLSANTTTLVSRPSGAAPYVGDVENSRFSEPFQNRIGADGRFVTFFSYADGLSNADDNHYGNVFVRDTLTDTTILVSVGPAGAANGNSDDETISADGTTVAFESSASNLVPGDTNKTTDVFVRNLATGATTMINTGLDGSWDASLSADGKKIAFETTHAFVPADTNKGSTDIYVEDLTTGAITLVSRANGAAGLVGDDSSFYPSISADGGKVAFYSNATNFGAAPSGQIYVRDLAAGTTSLVSRADGAGPAANYAPYYPVISGDGTAVAFDTTADNLVPGDSNGSNDVFVRNLATNTTTLVSRAAGGRLADGGSWNPALSANGDCVAFQSDAANLTPAAPRSDFDRIFMATVARECPVDPPETTITSARPALARTARSFCLGSASPARRACGSS